MSNSGLSPAAPLCRREPPIDKARVVSKRRLFPTNWVTGRTPQPSTEPVVANFSVSSDFLEDGQGSGLETVYPFSSEASSAHGFFLLKRGRHFHP